jgi:hypothetical protein
MIDGGSVIRGCSWKTYALGSILEKAIKWGLLYRM